MKQTSIFLVFSALFLVLAASLISASVSFVDMTGNSQTVKDGTSVTISFKLQESGQGNFTGISFNTPITLNSGSNSIISQSAVTGAISSLSANQTSASLMSLTFDIPTGKNSGTYTGNLIATGNYNNSSTNVTLPITITVNKELNFCDFSDNGHLDVNIEDITVTKGFGKDDSFYPFDEVEVEARVENNGNDDIKAITVEWGVYDTNKNQWYTDGKEKSFSLNNGDDKTVLINFKLDKKISKLDDSNLVLLVWATGKDDSANGNKTCARDSQSVDVTIENDFVILDNLKTSDTAECGSSLPITADVWNIGNDDQQNVRVLIFNKPLGINKEVEIGDIDAFEDGKLDVSVDLPKKADEKFYTIKVSVLNEDKETYSNDNDDDSSYDLPFKLEGSCKEGESKVAVSAVLESGGIAGDTTVIAVTLTNTGTKQSTYSLNAAGYTDLASSVTLDKQSVTLASGESAQILLTAELLKDIEGEKTFNFEVVSGNELVAKQPVSITVEKPASGFFSAIKDKLSSKGNGYLWGIAILNVILVILIIVVAVRLTRKK